MLSGRIHKYDGIHPRRLRCVTVLPNPKGVAIKDTVRNILRRPYVSSLLAITVITLGVKVVAAAKEIAVSYRYGVSDQLDAYLIAFLYASFMVSILSNSFNLAIVPTYVSVREKKGFRVACRLFGDITGWSLVFLLAVCLVLALLADSVIPIMGSGFSPQKMALTRNLVWVMLPVTLIFSLSAVWGSVLNAHQCFRLVALAPVCVPLAITALILWRGAAWGAYALAAGTVIGYVAELAVLGFRLRRQGISPRPRLGPPDGDLRHIGRQMLPLMVGSLMTTGMVMVDNAMAAMLAPGSVAALNYGYRLAGMIFTLCASLWIVALPEFSSLVVARRLPALVASLKNHFLGILLTGVPLALLLYLYSEPVVRLFFQRGAFTAADTRVVAQVQAYYVIQIPFYVLNMIMVRLLSAMHRNHILMISGSLNLGLNVVLNLVFIRIWGVAGIALSSSAVTVFSFLLLLFIVTAGLKKAEAADARNPETM
jgi:putative peptidoglycan lipid II flippase